MQDARRSRIRAERVRELYGRPGGRAFAPHVILALAALESLVVIWLRVEPARALAWLALMLTVQLGLVALIAVFHSRPRSDEELPLWARLRTVAEIVHGLAWASSFYLVYTPGEMVSLISCTALITGMSAGIAAGLGVHLPSMAAFVTASIPTSIAVLLATRTGPTEVYTSAMLVGGGLLVLANAARMSGLYDESIRLRLDLAAQLDERRQLQEAAEEGRRLAEEAAVERIRFFGAASHDLRQPVHALGLYASLLRRDPPARERRELIANIAVCVDSLDRLFNAILGVARAAKADHKEQSVAFPLQDVFDRTVLQFAPEAERRGLDLRQRRTALWVRGDPGVAERILSNLAANAVRYTERGGVLIAARPRRGSVELIVADTGVGLEEAERHRIFDAFYQVGLPHRDRAQGFGLGLATVRQLCLSHGYDIDVRSEPGRGTLFRVSLPRATAVAEPPPASPAGPEVPARLHVLLVEDDPLVADAVARLLTAWEASVHVCASADEALSALDGAREGRWHAILDYRLPGAKTGLDLADEIRRRYGGAVAISLLTGEVDPAVFEAAGRRGITVLQKPLKPIRLRALLATEAAAAEPRRAAPPAVLQA